jgi:hypothetical protein
MLLLKIRLQGLKYRKNVFCGEMVVVFVVVDVLLTS